MTAASIRAGISAYSHTDFFNKRDEPFTGALVPGGALPELHEDLRSIGLKGDEKRCIKLSHVALDEIEPWLPKIPITLFLAGPENIPARPIPFNKNIIHYIQRQSGISINLASSRYVSSGRAGVMQAIHSAFDYMSQTDENYILVGGVDTYCNTGLLSNLDAENRILALGISDGFALGDGAGFLLLCRQPHASFLKAAISPPGIAKEKGHRYNEEEPYLGDGLSDAVRLAIQHSNQTKIDTIYSSMNGESFFAKEHGVMSMRNAKAFTENNDMMHPADGYGDLGAATGAVLTALSAISFNQGQSDSQYQHLICCSSDMAARGAVCVSHVAV